jgi:hypothetical protein
VPSVLGLIPYRIQAEIVISGTMPKTRQRHFQLLAAQFELLLQTLGECQDAEVRTDFLLSVRLILDELEEIGSKKSPRLVSEDLPPSLGASID